MKMVLTTLLALAIGVGVPCSAAATGPDQVWKKEDFTGPGARSPAQGRPAKPRMTAEMADGAFRLVDGGSVKGDLLTFPRHWCATPEDGAACRASVKVVSCAGLAGVMLGFSDGVHEDLLTLYEDRIELHHAGLKHAMDTTDAFHEYQVDIRGTDVWVSVDGRRVIDGAGKSPYTPGYDWQGNLLTPDDPDAENRRIIRRVRRRFRAALPALIEGYNIQAWNAFKPDTPEVVEANLFPLSYSEFVPGNVMLDEKHYHTRADGTPTMHTTWAKTRKVLRRGNELVQRFGAHHYTGGMPNSGAGPFLLHAHSLAYALGVRTFGGGNHYGKYPTEYEAFLTFAQRYARHLFHPSRIRFLREGDETSDRVSVRCGRPVVHRPFCYYLGTNRMFTLIVHLWNQPLSEKMNVKHCEAPPVAADVVVTLRQPLGMIHDRGRAYVLSPEWSEWQRPVAIDATQPTIGVPVPAFRYWAMVVVQYPMIPSNIDKPAHHWFLPVQE